MAPAAIGDTEPLMTPPFKYPNSVLSIEPTVIVVAEIFVAWGSPWLPIKKR
jgi:hypothetical protein